MSRRKILLAAQFHLVYDTMILYYISWPLVMHWSFFQATAIFFTSPLKEWNFMNHLNPKVVSYQAFGLVEKIYQTHTLTWICSLFFQNCTKIVKLQRHLLRTVFLGNPTNFLFRVKSGLWWGFSKVSSGDVILLLIWMQAKCHWPFTNENSDSSSTLMDTRNF